MNKLIIVFVFLIYICIVKSQASDSSSAGESSTVNLIVNSNNKNVYPLNGECGTNSSNTCNNIVDAVNYFNTIAVVQTPPGVSVYSFQQLNLLLADGSYGVSSNSVNFYQYNVTISTLTPGSNQVIIDGTNPSSATPLFSVSPQSGVVEKVQTSYLFFTGLNFVNFTQTILIVSTQTFTNVVFETCSFSNYYSKGYSMVNINYGSDKSLLPNGNLRFNMSIFNNIISDSVPIISTTNSYISFTSTIVENGTFDNFFNCTYGENIKITNSTFIKLTTSTGIATSYDNYISIGDSYFNNNIANNGPAVLSFVNDESSNQNTFAISNSIFNDNSGINGGVVNGLNTNSSFIFGYCYIGDSQFNGGLAENGGVVYLDNLPITIENTVFSNNDASIAGGSIFVLSTAIPKTISLNNVTFTQSEITPNQVYYDRQEELLGAQSSSTTVKGSVIYVSGSILKIGKSKFDSKYTETIYCLSSKILIDAETEFNSASLSCGALCIASIDTTTVCGTTATATSSTSGTGIGSTGGTTGTVLSVTSSTSTSTTSTTTSTITGNTIKSNTPSFVLIFSIILTLSFNFI